MCNHGNRGNIKLKFAQLIEASSVVPRCTWRNRKWPRGRWRASESEKNWNKLIKIKQTPGIKREPSGSGTNQRYQSVSFNAVFSPTVQPVRSALPRSLYLGRQPAGQKHRSHMTTWLRLLTCLLWWRRQMTKTQEFSECQIRHLLRHWSRLLLSPANQNVRREQMWSLGKM